MYSITGLTPNFITTCKSGLYIMGGGKKEHSRLFTAHNSIIPLSQLNTIFLHHSKMPCILVRQDRIVAFSQVIPKANFLTN